MQHVLAILASEWIIHWVGDYPAQNSAIAYNKRLQLHSTFAQNLKTFAVCTLHGFIYCLPFLLFYSLDWQRSLLIATIHIIIDYFGLGSLWARTYNWDWADWRNVKPIAPFFVHLELDQGLHHCTNIVILSIPYLAEWKELFQLFGRC